MHKRSTSLNTFLHPNQLRRFRSEHEWEEEIGSFNSRIEAISFDSQLSDEGEDAVFEPQQATSTPREHTAATNPRGQLEAQTEISNSTSGPAAVERQPSVEEGRKKNTSTRELAETETNKPTAPARAPAEDQQQPGPSDREKNTTPRGQPEDPSETSEPANRQALRLRSGKTYLRKQGKGKSNFHYFFKPIVSKKCREIKGIQSEQPNQLSKAIISSATSETVQKTHSMPFEKVSKLISRLVPSFSGGNQSSNELQIFLDCSKQVFESLSADEQPIFLSLLKTRLRGDAYDLVKNVVITNFAQFETLLTNTYSPVKSINDLLGDLRRCTQYPSENINAYSGRLSRYLVNCKKAILTKYPQNHAALVAEVEQEAAYVFKTGIISPVIRQAVLSQPGNSLDGLIRLAKEIEETEIRMSAGRFQPQTSNLPASPIQTPTPPHANPSLQFQPPSQITPYSILPSSNHHQWQNSPPFESPQLHMPPQAVGAQPSRPPVQCTFCKRVGHTYQQCRTRLRIKCTVCNNQGHTAEACTQAQVLYNTSRNTQREPKRQNNIKCEWCARWGHDLNSCRAKLAYESRQQANSRKN